MPFLDTNHQRAALLILLLGAALVVALAPYATGIIGIAVLYAILSPVHDWLRKRVKGKVAAGLVVALALFLIVVPGVSFAGLIVNEAQGIAGSVVRSPLLKRLEELQPGGVELGPRLADLGAKLVSWIGSSATLPRCAGPSFSRSPSARSRASPGSPIPPRSPSSHSAWTS